MTGDITVPLEDLAEFLDGEQTTIVCAPGRGAEVARIMGESAVPQPLYRVIEDGNCTPGRVVIQRRGQVGDWSP